MLNFFSLSYFIINLILFNLFEVKLNSDDQQNIFDMARNGDTLKFQTWAKINKFNIDTADAHGYTLLILAIYNEQWDFARYLSKHYHPNFDAQDNSGNTALMGAAFKGYTTMGKWLLDQGAKPNTQNYNGASALIYCATFGRDSLAKYLLTKGANPKLQDKFGNTALKHAEMQGNQTMIQLLKTTNYNKPLKTKSTIKKRINRNQR